MKKSIHVFLILVSILVMTYCTNSVSEETTEETTALWPDIEPYQTDYLQVSDLHKIY